MWHSRACWCRAGRCQDLVHGQGLGQETQVATSATREAQRSRPQLSVTFRLLACTSLVHVEAWCHKFKLGQCHEGAVVCRPRYLRPLKRRCVALPFAQELGWQQHPCQPGTHRRRTSADHAVCSQRGAARPGARRQNIRRLSPEVQNASCFGPSSLITPPEDSGRNQTCTRRVPV